VAGHIFQARPVWICTQSNIANNAYVKTRLQAIETLHFECAKCVLHTESACLKSIIARITKIRIPNSPCRH
jgi:hypothetical protein